MNASAESRVLKAALIAGLVFAAADIFLYRHLAALNTSAKTQMDMLTEMRTLDAEFRNVVGTGAQPVLAAGKSLDSAAVNAVAAKVLTGDVVSSVTEHTRAVNDKMQEEVVSVSLRKVSHDNLARFLHAVEEIAPVIVKTKSLRIQPSPGQAGMFDSSVEFSAYAEIAQK